MWPWSLAGVSALVLKVPLVAILVLYSLFAFIIARQVEIMHRTIPTSIGTVLRIIALIHFGLALVLTATSIGIL